MTEAELRLADRVAELESALDDALRSLTEERWLRSNLEARMFESFSRRILAAQLIAQGAVDLWTNADRRYHHAMGHAWDGRQWT